MGIKDAGFSYSDSMQTSVFKLMSTVAELMERIEKLEKVQQSADNCTSEDEYKDSGWLSSQHAEALHQDINVYLRKAFQTEPLQTEIRAHVGKIINNYTIPTQLNRK